MPYLSSDDLNFPAFCSVWGLRVVSCDLIPKREGTVLFPNLVGTYIHFWASFLGELL